MITFSTMKILVFIILILVSGCRDTNSLGYTACDTKESDQRILIKFEHFKSDFDVYWHDEEKTTSISLSKSKFSEEQKQNLLSSISDSTNIKDAISVVLYTDQLKDQINLDSSYIKGVIVYYNVNDELSIELYSNESNRLRKLIESPVSFLSTNDIINVGEKISFLHEASEMHSLAFIDYSQIPKVRLSRPILSEVIDSLLIIE